MNKADARKYACRLVLGFIEELFEAGSDPLVYDEYFQDWSGKTAEKDDLPGRRLSKGDLDRVYDAMAQLADKLDREGWGELTSFLKADYHERKKQKWPKPSGKPGPQWTEYKTWLGRQGRA